MGLRGRPSPLHCGSVSAGLGGGLSDPTPACFHLRSSQEDSVSTHAHCLSPLGEARCGRRGDTQPLVCAGAGTLLGSVL